MNGWIELHAALHGSSLLIAII